MRESPIYAGAGYLAIKRTGASALIGVRAGRWRWVLGGLAVLIGALVAMWVSESGRRLWRRRG